MELLARKDWNGMYHEIGSPRGQQNPASKISQTRQGLSFSGRSNGGMHLKQRWHATDRRNALPRSTLVVSKKRVVVMQSVDPASKQGMIPIFQA